MRAAVLRAYREPLSLETVPDPACEADGVVLKTLACGICRSDWHGWVGEHPKVKPGDIPGHEYCGEVVEAGPLAKWRKGDRVIAPFILACGDCPECRSGQTTTCRSQRVPGFGDRGAYAEFVSVPHAHNLTRLPESLSPALAAGLGCRVTTAFHALTGRAALQAGEWLAVHGTGGIGLSSLGAEAALDAREGDVAARIVDLTNGGAHVSVEALGIEATANNSLKCLRPLGRHVQVGLPTGHTAQMQIDMNTLYMRQLSVFGTRGMPAWRYPTLLSLIETGRIDVSPIVARTVPLSQATEELRAFDGPTAPGVAVITDFAG
jgi:alcohol dehydrogenase